jgi:hypothetical protein
MNQSNLAQDSVCMLSFVDFEFLKATFEHPRGATQKLIGQFLASNFQIDLSREVLLINIRLIYIIIKCETTAILSYPPGIKYQPENSGCCCWAIFCMSHATKYAKTHITLQPLDQKKCTQGAIAGHFTAHLLYIQSKKIRGGPTELGG